MSAFHAIHNTSRLGLRSTHFGYWPSGASAASGHGKNSPRVQPSHDASDHYAEAK
jgi:hypothetical protein